MQDLTEQDAYARGVADALALVETVQIAAPDLLAHLGARPTLARLAEILPTYDTTQLGILKPYSRCEALPLKVAADMVGRSESTLREWITKYGIGRSVVGSTEVSAVALMMLMDDDALALSCLLMGLRDHPTVRPYMERAGIRMAA